MQLARKSQMPLHDSLFGREDLERDPRQRSGRRSRRPVGVWQEVGTIMLRMSMLQDLPQNDVLANKVNKAIEYRGLPDRAPQDCIYIFPRWFCWDSATMLRRKKTLCIRSLSEPLPKTFKTLVMLVLLRRSNIFA